MAGKTNAELYDERVKRVSDQVALKQTDRTPFVYGSRFWAATYAGITFAELMYDPDKAVDATRKVVELLKPDAFSASLYCYGRTLEELDYKPMKWPGHSADKNASFQYIDEEFMTAKEYDEYLSDPTLFYLHKYLPRISPTLAKAFGNMPDLASLSEWRFIIGMRAFANPELQEGFRKLFKAAEAAEEGVQKTIAFVNEMKEKGYPHAAGSFCKAPYDHFVDFLRGSKGGMLDMFRKKDKLLEATEKAGDYLLRKVDEEASKSGSPYVFIPLHWGLDGFMSPDQFKTFYWPGLKRIMTHLIDKDLVPLVLWEGNCTSRLELIGDIPQGKAIYWFESTDIFKAKEILGDTVCLRGNVPASILCTGTADDVDAYCKRLITEVGKGGGFILDGATSIPDEAKTENVLAMANSVHKYAN
ncbi:MAG: hypothetical protein KDJ46_03445 [Rhodobiaceae bacterium]|nr:hypothetical protein [Rhodobiaceae bacterium]